jgi:putative sporulation protein YyaC
MTRIVTSTTEEIFEALNSLIPKKICNDDVVFCCIGTDRSTGDSLAPLIGSRLKNLGYQNIIGTIDEPLHALNLEEKIKTIDSSKFIVAIDACLGKKENINSIFITDKPLKPGKAVNKKLPSIGNISIKAVVNYTAHCTELNHRILQSTRLSHVIQMADKITQSISILLPLENKKMSIKINKDNKMRGIYELCQKWLISRHRLILWEKSTRNVLK